MPQTDEALASLIVGVLEALLAILEELDANAVIDLEGVRDALSARADLMGREDASMRIPLEMLVDRLDDLIGPPEDEPPEGL